MSTIARVALGLLFSLLLVSLPALSLGLESRVARADSISVREVTVTPKKVLAIGGEAIVEVTVGGTVTAADTRVTLSTALGAFGAPNGPNRISLAVQPTGTDGGVAHTTLFGDGRSGAAAVTAHIGQTVRTTVVIFVGNPAAIRFTSIESGTVLPAGALPRVDLQVTDANGFTVPEATVTLSASGALLRRLRDGSEIGASTLTLRTDTNGIVFVFLAGEPGLVTLAATSGAVSATLSLTLHGPATSLQLLALRSAVNLGDTPFPAPPGTLVASVLDDGGRPVPNTAIEFTADQPGVSVVVTGAGESNVTDAGGRAVGHVSAAASASLGLGTITARAGDLQAAVQVRVVGFVEQVTLNVMPSSTNGAASSNAYRVTVALIDALGQAAPTGYHVRFSADNPTQSERLSIAADLVLVRDGVAETTVTVLDPIDGVRIRATVEEAEGVSGSALLPITTVVAEGFALVPGLNLVIWTGPPTSVQAAIAPVAGTVAAVWLVQDSQGWLGYFPVAGLGVNFDVRPGDQLFIFVRAAVVLPLP